ncbi:MAG TPA: aspartate--tRNA ligase, partial [Candidatus Sulfotelmatobacter sp.]|nr:aspartate--tRNA ligase [Candidatus Sulfotelmatobacter sp.]
MKRTHYCGEIRAAAVGSQVVVNGWVHRRRDHGGLIFIDLRDRSGLVQVVFSSKDVDLHVKAQELRGEYVVAVTGKVVKRSPETVNKELPSGEIEIAAESLEILNSAKTPPFEIADARTEPDETVRLKYRYIDLRKEKMRENLVFRHKVIKAMADYLDKQGFLEIETPFLGKSTPEGARDYLVPSRVNPGKFYALPQSPQLFKQILMVAGMEKYFQVARCFRDEDLRADRQPEFTQLDIEMSFVEEKNIIELIEGMIKQSLDALEKDIDLYRGKNIPKVSLPFPRLTWNEAISRFGVDKPDTRFGLELVDVSDLVRSSEFGVFRTVVEKGGLVKGINIKGGEKLSRSELDNLEAKAKTLGAKGMAWIALGAEGMRSPIVKFFKPAEVNAIVERMKGETGDVLIFCADTFKTVHAVLGELRL